MTINFRRIYFSNAQVIPKDKPVILAANHPSAFMEPCILAVLLPRPLHFLVRGDFFAKPLFDKILRSLHMLPIFRMKDGGYKKLKDNFSTFDKCFTTLKDGKVIMILAEGTTVHEKRLRPLQKGTARLAFGTLEKYPDLDIQIIPVGVNYTNADQFRSHAMIEFGQPIAAQDYLAVYQKDANEATRQLMTKLRSQLKKHIVHIESKEDEALVEKLFSINCNNWPEPAQPAVSKNNYRLKSEIQIANAINQMALADKKVLEIKVDEYLKNLERNKLSDYAIAIGKGPDKRSIIVLILGFLPFLFGYIGNYLPIKLADWGINRIVKAVEFRASVKVTTAIIVYLLYILGLFLFFLITGRYTSVFILLALPFFGYYALLYQEYVQKWWTLRQFKRLDTSDLNNFRDIRRAILSGLTTKTEV